MRALLAALVFALLAGCSTVVPGSPVVPDDHPLVDAYFKALNDSAAKGADSQLTFLEQTQHPDFKNLLCDLGGVTVTVTPVLSTLRIDQQWTPESGKRPRGDVYVVAVSLRIRKDGRVLGDQIGSERIVVLDGHVYGFMPCLR
jgi:hypothetical protein